MRMPELRFYFSLARELGKTVEEVLTGAPGPLSAWEITHWKALAMLEALERHIG